MARRLLLALPLLALTSVSPAHASTVAYQCGTDNAPMTCVVDPDSTAPPLTVAGSAGPAGVSRDGRIVYYLVVAPSGVEVMRHLMDGSQPDSDAGFPIFATGSYAMVSGDGSQMVLSVDGSNGVPSSAVRVYHAGSSARDDVATSDGWMDGGWLGEQPMATRPMNDGGATSRICGETVGTTETGCSDVLASDPAMNIGLPAGSPDGTSIAAVRANLPDSPSTSPLYGRIAIYSTRTHALVRDLTDGVPDKSQVADTHPAFSNESDRVVFERDRGDDNGIFVIDPAGGTPRRIATGRAPFWGGPRDPGTAPPPVAAPSPGTPSQSTPQAGSAPQAAAPATHRPQLLSRALRLRAGRIPVQIRCIAKTTCHGTLRLRTATRQVAHVSYAVAAARTVTLSLRPTGSLRHVHRLTVTLTPAGSHPSSRSLPLRR